MNEDPTREALTRVADALERNTAALESILQRLAEPEPEPTPEAAPEPKPSARAVLYLAWDSAAIDSSEESILEAAWRYAQEYPEWFVQWADFETLESALLSAATRAAAAGNMVARNLLVTVSVLTETAPDLFADTP